MSGGSMIEQTISWNGTGFQARPATLDDIELVVDLSNTVAIHDTGRTITNREDKLIEWGLPRFDLETDTLLVFSNGREPGGAQLAGYVELWDSEPHVRHYLWGRVHPDYRGLGIGRYLMEWAEARAGQSLDRARPDAQVSIHTSTPHQVEAAHALFQMRHYAASRHFFGMLKEMVPGSPPPAPSWPEGIRVRPYELGRDDRVVHRVLDESFQDHWGYVEGETFEEWFHWIEEDEKFDPSVCFLAVTEAGGGEQIVGVFMARLEWEQVPEYAIVDELGVLRPWRRRGIGSALLCQGFGEFYRRGRYEVALSVDGDSLTGATRLYERAGMRVFRQLDVYEKILRPGTELAIQALEEQE